MSDEVADLVADVASQFVDDVAAWGVRLGVYAVKSALGLRKKATNGGPLSPERCLNTLLNAGMFDEAERYVRSLNLPDSAQWEVLDQIAAVRREYEPRLARIRQWNETIRRRMAEGRFDEAASFVESLDLPCEQQQEVVQGIRRIEELTRLLEAGQFAAARKYIKSMPIDQSAKDALLAKLPQTGSFWSRLFRT